MLELTFGRYGVNKFQIPQFDVLASLSPSKPALGELQYLVDSAELLFRAQIKPSESEFCYSQYQYDLESILINPLHLAVDSQSFVYPRQSSVKKINCAAGKKFESPDNKQRWSCLGLADAYMQVSNVLLDEAFGSDQSATKMEFRQALVANKSHAVTGNRLTTTIDNGVVQSYWTTDGFRQSNLSTNYEPRSEHTFDFNNGRVYQELIADKVGRVLINELSEQTKVSAVFCSDPNKSCYSFYSGATPEQVYQTAISHDRSNIAYCYAVASDIVPITTYTLRHFTRSKNRFEYSDPLFVDEMNQFRLKFGRYVNK